MTNQRDNIKLTDLLRIWATECGETEPSIKRTLADLIERHESKDKILSKNEAWEEDLILSGKKRDQQRIKAKTLILYLRSNDPKGRAYILYENFPYPETIVLSKAWLRKIFRMEKNPHLPAFLTTPDNTPQRGRRPESERDKMLQEAANQEASKFYQNKNRFPSKEEIVKILRKENVWCERFKTEARMLKCFKNEWKKK